MVETLPVRKPIPLNVNRFPADHREEVIKLNQFMEQVHTAIKKLADGMKPDGSGQPLP